MPQDESIDVEMPDGTVIEDVPSGMPKAEVMRRFVKMKAAPSQLIANKQNAMSPEQLAYGPEAMSPATPFKKFGGAVYDVAKGTAQAFIPPGSAPVQGESAGAALKRTFSPETTLLPYGAPYRAAKGMIAPLADAPAAAAGVLEDYKMAFTGDTEGLYQKGLAYLNQAPEATGQVFALEAGGKLAGKVNEASRSAARGRAAAAENAPSVEALKSRIASGERLAGPETVNRAARQETIANARQQLTERIRGNVEETHAAARSSLDTRWNSMRDKVGQAPADPAKLAQVEADARNANLAIATPDAVAKFDSVMDRVREPGATPEAALEQKVAEGLGYKTAEQARRRVPAQAFDGMVERLKSEGMTEVMGNTFGELQNRYTRLGDELSKGNLPNETYRALKQVREGYGQHMQELAGQHGMGNELASLKSDWSQYMEDFRNPDSPVARALNAKDLPVVTKNASGNTYARFAEIMGRNKQHGGNPVLVQEMAGLTAREIALRELRPARKPGKLATVAGKSRLRTLLGEGVGALASSAVGIPHWLGWRIGGEAARSLPKALGTKTPRR